MTELEKTEKQNQVKKAWLEAGGFKSWSLNKETCTMKSPKPYPNDEKPYKWDEESLSWIEIKINK